MHSIKVILDVFIAILVILCLMQLWLNNHS